MNSNSELEQLLDDSGQLRQECPVNIYIGGQSLDRGVTIANVIGFFYGRYPRWPSKTRPFSIAACTDRPEGDVAVMRFYTSNGIYPPMARMHDFYMTLWEHLTVPEEMGRASTTWGR